MVKRTNIGIRKGDMDVVSPRIRTFRDLSEVGGGSNVDPRIGAKTDPLPPDPPSFVLPERGRTSRKAPAGWDAVITGALTRLAPFDMGWPKGSTNGVGDLICKSAKGPSLIGEGSSWRDTSLA